MTTLDIVENLLQNRLIYLYIYFTCIFYCNAYGTDKRKKNLAKLNFSPHLIPNLRY